MTANPEARDFARWLAASSGLVIPETLEDDGDPPYREKGRATGRCLSC